MMMIMKISNKDNVDINTHNNDKYSYNNNAPSCTCDSMTAHLQRCPGARSRCPTGLASPTSVPSSPLMHSSQTTLPAEASARTPWSATEWPRSTPGCPANPQAPLLHSPTCAMVSHWAICLIVAVRANASSSDRRRHTIDLFNSSPKLLYVIHTQIQMSI